MTLTELRFRPFPCRRIRLALEEDLAEKLGNRSLKALYGQYEPPENTALCVDEVFMQGWKLYAEFLGEEVGFTSQLYPIGGKPFGRKGGFAKIVFGENCLLIDGFTCKKM